MLIPKAFMLFLTELRLVGNKSSNYPIQTALSSLTFRDKGQDRTGGPLSWRKSLGSWALSHRKDGWVFQAEQTRHTAVKERVGFI